MVFLTSNLLQLNSPGSINEYRTDQQVKKKEITICALEDYLHHDITIDFDGGLC